MRYFYDTEFIEDGKTIDLISIGIAAEDGREFYAVSKEFNPKKASDWVKENVLAYLPHRDVNPAEVSPRIWEESKAWKTRAEIMKEVFHFCSVEKFGEPEFWGYYSAYDHVALCQLFGTMMDLPPGWPYYTKDLQQLAESLGYKSIEKLIPNEKEHHALADARWNKRVWEYLTSEGGIGR